MDVNLWPMNTSSLTPDTNVDWPPVPFANLRTATPALIRKIQRNQLLLLKDRNPLHWEELPADCREAAMAIIEGRREERVKRATKKDGSKKDELLSKLAAIMEEAEAGGDLSAQLKTVEMEAKLEALLNQRVTDEDRNVVINVITGVNR